MTDRVVWDDTKARQAERDAQLVEKRERSRAQVALRFEIAQLVYDLRTGARLTQHQLADRMRTTQSASRDSSRRVGCRHCRC